MEKGVIEGIVAGSPEGPVFIACNYAVCCRPGHVVKLPDYHQGDPGSLIRLGWLCADDRSNRERVADALVGFARRALRTR